MYTHIHTYTPSPVCVRNRMLHYIFLCIGDILEPKVIYFSTTLYLVTFGISTAAVVKADRYQTVGCAAPQVSVFVLSY